MRKEIQKNTRYFDGSFATIIVYTIDDAESFRYTQNLLDYLITFTQTPFELYHVGSKKYKINARKVPEESGIVMSKKMSAYFYEVSFKTSEGIEDLFGKIYEIFHFKCTYENHKRSKCIILL